jgi:hypothetical protein
MLYFKLTRVNKEMGFGNTYFCFHIYKSKFTDLNTIYDTLKKRICNFRHALSWLKFCYFI